MGGLEITLIVIGLIIIAISYVVSEKMTSTQEEVKELETVADYERRKELEENVSVRLEAMAEEAMEKVEAHLCKLSNEKIMAVNEYGDMVLERIDKNHSEVVFLYSMLTDKEKELKQVVCMPFVPEQAEDPIEPPVIQEEVQKHDSTAIDHSVELLSESHEIILNYLNAGKSIREISKELNLGQGEVQLVANLYAGGRK